MGNPAYARLVLGIENQRKIDTEPVACGRLITDVLPPDGRLLGNHSLSEIPRFHLDPVDVAVGVVNIAGPQVSRR